MSGPIDDAVTLGAALREAREVAGRTVEQVSADTRIRATLVRDLEADRFESSGGSVYARGHIKSIASALRVDPAPLLALFDHAAGAAPELLLTPEPLPGPVTSLGGSAFAAASAAALNPERRGPRWGVALTGAAAVLIGVTALGYSQQGASPSRNADVLGAAGTPSSAPSAPATVRTPGPDSVAAKPAVTGAQLRLRIIGGASWVSVSNASATLFEGILKDGEFRDFNDPARLKVVVGNPPAVNLNCGGRDSGPTAADNRKVLRFACTSAGLAPL